MCFVFQALMTLAAFAQTAPPPRPAFGITDNSFLVEEAFNQEAGVFQNIFVWTRTGSDWDLTFTQEWPIKTMAHQFSFTLDVQQAGGNRGSGDTLINYRYQLWEEGPGRPAFSPRISVVLPTGNRDKGLGQGATGLQINLPFSKRHGDLYWHWNAGLTWHPGLMSPQVAASTVWQVRPLLDLMLEHVLAFEDAVTGPGTSARTRQYTLAPGIRFGWNLGDRQLVFGTAAPVTFAQGGRQMAWLLYGSYELPFRR